MIFSKNKVLSVVLLIALVFSLGGFAKKAEAPAASGGDAKICQMEPKNIAKKQLVKCVLHQSGKLNLQPKAYKTYIKILLTS